MYQDATVKHGFDTQAKSKEALNRIQRRVQQTIDLADESLTNIEKQNQQILRINQSVERMDGTMDRTKKFLTYFGRSFFRDKIALCFLIMIVLTIAAIIYVAILPNKNSKKMEFLDS